MPKIVQITATQHFVYGLADDGKVYLFRHPDEPERVYGREQEWRWCEISMEFHNV